MVLRFDNKIIKSSRNNKNNNNSNRSSSSSSKNDNNSGISKPSATERAHVRKWGKKKGWGEEREGWQDEGVGRKVF